MRVRSRFRRFAKWMSLIACSEMALVWLAGLECDKGIETLGHYAGIGVTDGVLWAYCGQIPHARPPEGGVWSHLHPGEAAYWEVVWDLAFEFGETTWWRPHLQIGHGRILVYVPLCVLLGPVGGLAALLWWRDRRVPAGHCERCGYDLTGNVSGVCPECGQKVSQACHSEGTK